MADYIAFLDADDVVTKVVQAPNNKTNWAVVWGQQNNCKCIVTTKDGSIRRNYAFPGCKYFFELDAFATPSPFPSWVLNKVTIKWEPPVPKPADAENVYVWDEETVSWKNLGPSELLEAGSTVPEVDTTGLFGEGEVAGNVKAPDRKTKPKAKTKTSGGEHKRARNEDGTYKGDDPSTPDVNEAWEDG